MDFSNIKVEEAFVENVNNDCLDVSYGDYNFNRLNLKNCGDKAISIGEKSDVKLNKIKIENTNYGMVVKDSSTAVVDNIDVKKSNICLSAYNKKQMFYGGFAKIKNLRCESFDINSEVDIFSSIQVENNYKF
mgnify:FL=1